MGLTFSTKNYNNIINISLEDTIDPFDATTGHGIQVWSPEEQNKRHLVYKHQTKNIFLLYIGNVSDIAKCLEVDERFLERRALHFGNFSILKQYIIKNYPGAELVSELIKYESIQDKSITLPLAYVPNNVLMVEKEYLFTDSCDTGDDWDTSDTSDTSDTYSYDSSESILSISEQSHANLNIKPFDYITENFSTIEDTFTVNKKVDDIKYDSINSPANEASYLYNYPFHNGDTFNKCAADISFEPFMPMLEKIPTLHSDTVEKCVHSQTSLGTAPIKPRAPQNDYPPVQLTPIPILHSPSPSSPTSWTPTTPPRTPTSPDKGSFVRSIIPNLKYLRLLKDT